MRLKIEEVMAVNCKYRKINLVIDTLEKLHENQNAVHIDVLHNIC